MKEDDFVKSPSAALRFICGPEGRAPQGPHSSVFARLASGAFYEASQTFYDHRRSGKKGKGDSDAHCHIG